MEVQHRAQRVGNHSKPISESQKYNDFNDSPLWL